jgi:hypothetical protein
MMNLDALCRQVFERHQERLAAASRRRLASSKAPSPTVGEAPAHGLRGVLATWLRRIADRLEPSADRPSVVVLRNRLTR